MGPVSRPNMVSVGTIVWLSSELMFFAGLFAIFFTVRSMRPDLWEKNLGLLDVPRSEEHTSELQSRFDLVCRLLLGKKNRQSDHWEWSLEAARRRNGVEDTHADEE